MPDFMSQLPDQGDNIDRQTVVRMNPHLSDVQVDQQIL